MWDVGGLSAKRGIWDGGAYWLGEGVHGHKGGRVVRGIGAMLLYRVNKSLLGVGGGHSSLFLPAIRVRNSMPTGHGH